MGNWRRGWRRKGILWEYNFDGRDAFERLGKFWKRYWRRWWRRRINKEEESDGAEQQD